MKTQRGSDGGGLSAWTHGADLLPLSLPAVWSREGVAAWREEPSGDEDWGASGRRGDVTTASEHVAFWFS